MAAMWWHYRSRHFAGNLVRTAHLQRGFLPPLAIPKEVPMRHRIRVVLALLALAGGPVLALGCSGETPTHSSSPTRPLADGTDTTHHCNGGVGSGGTC